MLDPKTLPKQSAPDISAHSRAHKPKPIKLVKTKASTKGKKSAGKLAQLMEMPMDIFYEVRDSLYRASAP